RRAGFGIDSNSKDVISSKNEDVAIMRLDEVIAELVDKNLVARIDGAARNDITEFVRAARHDVEISAQCIRRCVDQKGLTLTDNAREGKKEEELLWQNLHDPVVLL